MESTEAGMRGHAQHSQMYRQNSDKWCGNLGLSMENLVGNFLERDGDYYTLFMLCSSANVLPGKEICSLGFSIHILRPGEKSALRPQAYT